MMNGTRYVSVMREEIEIHRLLIYVKNQCWNTNVKANLHLFREAEPTFNANPEGGAFIITSSVAVSRVGPVIHKHD